MDNNTIITHEVTNDMSDGAMALQCCRELLDYMRRANAVAPVAGKKEPPHA